MTTDRSKPRWLAVGLAAIIALAGQTGCGAHTSAPSITVLAAASLQPAFTRIAARFEADNPGTAVRFNFASSPELATQLLHGATGDVFASADTAQLDKVAQAGLIAGSPVTFASNTLVIVTQPGNPKHVATFSDLARPDLKVVVSPPPMPCGVATRRVEEATGVQLNPVSSEPDVEDVLNKVSTGEADAGLVNVTDAITAGDKVTTVRFPAAAEALTSYPIAVLDKAPQPGLATRFVELVAGEAGGRILAEAGFGRP